VPGAARVFQVAVANARSCDYEFGRGGHGSKRLATSPIAIFAERRRIEVCDWLTWSVENDRVEYAYTVSPGRSQQVVLARDRHLQTATEK
jgi:hypothetical protein